MTPPHMASSVDPRPIVKLTVLGHISPELREVFDSGNTQSTHRYEVDQNIDALVDRGERAFYAVATTPESVRGLGIGFDLFIAQQCQATLTLVLIDQCGSVDDDVLDEVELTIREHLSEAGISADDARVLRIHAGMAPFNREKWAERTDELFTVLDELTWPSPIDPEPLLFSRLDEQGHLIRLRSPFGDISHAR
ncbi:MAG: hypothetical protein U0165_07300 [Polyangiaceae bacterium]